MTVSCFPEESLEKKDKATWRAQKTLKNAATISGVGLFSGQSVTLTIQPAESDHGIVFQRMDLPNCPRIPAVVEKVVSTPRCTILGEGGVAIQTVEHLLAALKGLEIDNALIQIDGAEVAILDGSSLPFVQVLQRAGTISQDKPRPVYFLSSPVYFSQGDVHLVALPFDRFQVSCTLHYPQSELLRAQYYSFQLTTKGFLEEISPCRTFCFYEEIAPLIEKGLLKGGDLNSGIVIQNEKVLGEEGLRFKDEMVRHKILDIIGDLSLLGFDLCAHIIAIRSGHASHVALAKLIKQEITQCP